ncbi:hypothetical protein [Streptomyces sp. NPDC090445]|uniref:hypothetical protein n=1 Tax=Streptomyces sp. NPDC090445 TaxID=3365963 RepID=UPI003803906C
MLFGTPGSPPSQPQGPGSAGPYAAAPPAQPYPGQPYPGQPYPGQPYPGQPYPAAPHGAALLRSPLGLGTALTVLLSVTAAVNLFSSAVSAYT